MKKIAGDMGALNSTIKGKYPKLSKGIYPR